MDLNIINKLIKDNEQSEVTLSSVRNLSSLYIVKEHVINSHDDAVTKELNDILPSYTNYVKIKRKYQLKETEDYNVCISLRNVCKEIKEFLHILYSNTDMPDERNIIKNMLEDLQNIS